MWPLMTSEVMLYLMKKLRLHNVSINRIFYQNQFINKYAGKITIYSHLFLNSKQYLTLMDIGYVCITFHLMISLHCTIDMIDINRQLIPSFWSHKIA